MQQILHEDRFRTPDRSSSAFRRNIMKKEQEFKQTDAAPSEAIPSPGKETPSPNEINPDWAHECIQDIDDWIESQGVYLRQ